MLNSVFVTILGILAPIFLNAICTFTLRRNNSPINTRAIIYTKTIQILIPNNLTIPISNPYTIIL